MTSVSLSLRKRFSKRGVASVGPNLDENFATVPSSSAPPTLRMFDTGNKGTPC